MTAFLVFLAVLLVLGGAATVFAVMGWRRLGGRRLTRQVRLQLAGETARSPVHRAVARWRQVLDAEATQTRRTLEAARRAGAPLADFGVLVGMLETAIADLDRELDLVAHELDAGLVDRALRTDLGRRAEEVVQTATRLRLAMSRSMSSGSAAVLREIVESTELSVTALSYALDELDRTAAASWDQPLVSSHDSYLQKENKVMDEIAADGLTCPKCRGTMRRYERSRVVIDQCSECRGIFLDAGELETLMQAEDAHYRNAPAPPQGYPQQQGYAQQGYPPQQGYGSEGFLGSLFGPRHGGHHGGHH